MDNHIKHKQIKNQVHLTPLEVVGDWIELVTNIIIRCFQARVKEKHQVSILAACLMEKSFSPKNSTISLGKVWF